MLRGADVFVRGVLSADSRVTADEEVTVYAHLPYDDDGRDSRREKRSKANAVPRGLSASSSARGYPASNGPNTSRHPWEWE